MSQVASGCGDAQIAELALLKDMVGVRKGLAALMNGKTLPEREAVLGVLEAELQVYASQGVFVKKEMALRAICTALREGKIGVETVLQNAGVQPDGKGKASGGDGGFFARIGKRFR